MMTNSSCHFFVPLCAPGLNIVRPKMKKVGNMLNILPDDKIQSKRWQKFLILS